MKKHCNYHYPDMVKQLGAFSLNVKAGNFTDSEIIVLLGQNGNHLLKAFIYFTKKRNWKNNFHSNVSRSYKARYWRSNDGTPREL